MPLFIIPFPAIDPVAVSLGPFAIRWYALAYIVGLIIGWRYCLMLADRSPRLIGRKEIDDFLIWATLGVVLGGRVGFVLFYNLPYYIDNPLQIFELWHGGMSFHGGALGVTLAIIVFCRQRGLSIFALSDIVVEAIPIGLFFGRIANFINGELWGRMTDVAWAIIFPGGAVGANQVPPHLLGVCQSVTLADGSPGFNCPRHPSEIYEAACEGVLLFLLLFYFEHRRVRPRPGIETGIFLVGYAIARIFGEFFREPDVQVGFQIFGSTRGQILSIPVLAAGIAIVWWKRQSVPAAAEEQ
ncbi:MAG TPA: prolipoprotein diacylglyceryl transferase [Stellaceae bacterium]|nr:prolipoprotein diacylglyceryl transferase [Stellaceae bacterium]